MGMITIEVWDATGNKKQAIELPSDAAVNRVIAVLVERMELPRYSPDNQLMSYKFHHPPAAGSCWMMRLLKRPVCKTGTSFDSSRKLRRDNAIIRSREVHLEEILKMKDEDGRFSRFGLIGWWDQERLAQAKVLVIGAGALGNEILKNLALWAWGMCLSRTWTGLRTRICRARCCFARMTWARAKQK